MLEDGPSKLQGWSQEVLGNKHPQMNDRYPVLGNLKREQNSAYGLLWPFYDFLGMADENNKGPKTILRLLI